MMNEDTKRVVDVSATGVDVISDTGAAAMLPEELIMTLGAPTEELDGELCNVARMASAMVQDLFPEATLDTQVLKLAEECDEMYFGGNTRAGLVDVAIVALQILYDYKCMVGLCILRAALQEVSMHTEDDWKEFLSACHDKIGTSYMRNALKFWKSDASSLSVPVYRRSSDYAE